MTVQLLTIDEVAAILKFHPKSIYRLIQRDGFPKPVKVGGASRWPETAVNAWLEARGVAA